MSIGIELKEDAEKLVRMAIDNCVAITQLRRLLDVANTRSLPDIEVHIKYQMGRVGSKGGSVIPFQFGEALLAMLQKYGSSKQSFFKLLQYTAMLHPYEEKKRAQELRDKVEPVVRNLTGTYGYKGLDISASEGRVQLKVFLANFHGSPKDLSARIVGELKSKIKELSGNDIRIWIEG